jgi:hypothetical protein
LTSLEGVGYIGGDFFCDNNKLVSLILVERKFWHIIVSLMKYHLVGGPENIKVVFYCDSNKLESLHGCPDVGGDFHFSLE